MKAMARVGIPEDWVRLTSAKCVDPLLMSCGDLSVRIVELEEVVIVAKDERRPTGSAVDRGRLISAAPVGSGRP